MDPLAFYSRAAERFSALFGELDSLKARLRAEGSTWPAWCQLPDQLVAERTAQLGLDRATSPVDFEVAMTAYGWRRSRDTFRFEPRLLRSMVDSQVQGLVGVDVLSKLPESCVFIEAPGLAGAAGFFVRLDFEQVGAHERMWLRFLALGRDAVMPWAMRFGLGQSVEQALRHSQRSRLLEPGGPYAANADSEVLETNAHALVSLVLCLCYARADLKQELDRNVVAGRHWTVGRTLAREVVEAGSYVGASWKVVFAEDLSAGGLEWSHPSLGRLPFKKF